MREWLCNALLWGSLLVLPVALGTANWPGIVGASAVMSVALLACR